MKSILLTAAILLLSLGVMAQVQPSLVKDINPYGNGRPDQFIAYQGKTYFSANDSLHGIELWVTDGTEAGTMLVRDINPGLASSQPYGMFVFNNKLFFIASDGTYGAELWMSDGTSAGTAIFMDINPGSAPSLPSFARNEGIPIQYNGKLLFAASNGTSGSELWITDGTTAGTALLKDILPGSASSNILWDRGCILFQNKLFFAAIDSPGSYHRLYATDCTSAGTQRVSNTLFPPIQSIRLFNSQLFFGANSLTGGSGAELWVSDGTDAGTQMLKDINTGSAPSAPYDLTVAGNKLYFTAVNATTGRELWVSDGTTTGTQMVKEIRAGAVGSLPTGDALFLYNGRVYFISNDGVNGAGLWASDGTAAGTVLIKDHSSDPLDTTGSIYSPVVYNGRFIYQDYVVGLGGWQLFMTDGTTDSTRVLSPAISPGVNPLILSGYHRVCNGTLYFAAAYTSIGNELYKLVLPPATGIASTPPELAFSIYPNPAAQHVMIALPQQSSNDPLQIHIADVSGKILVSSAQPWQPVITLPVHQLPAGHYLLQIAGKEGSGRKLFVKY